MTMAGQKDQHGDSNLYPLSHGQEALWFLHNLSPKHCAYNINVAWHIAYELDVAFLTKALQAVVDNHPSLRTTFERGGQGELRQRIHRETGLDFLQVDASCWSREYLHEVIVQETYRPFDLAAGPISRWRLYCSGKAENVLLLGIHHIITDYGSIFMMMEELSAMFAEGRIIVTGVGTNDFPYGDFVLKQRERLSGKHGEKLYRYWQKQLEGRVEPLHLPTDHPRPPELNSRGDQLRISIPAGLVDKLRLVARREGVGLNVLCLAAYALLLHRYSGQPHILVSFPVTGRTAKYRKVLGYFVNPVVLVLGFDHEQDGPSLIRQVQQRLFHALLNKDFPFSKVVSAFATSRRSDLAPVSQAMFSWLDFETFAKNDGFFRVTEHGNEWRIGEMTWQQYDLRGQTDDFDVVLEINHGLEGDVVHLQYNENLFTGKTVEGMANHYLALLSVMAEMPEVPVSRWPLMKPEEQGRVLSEWSNRGRLIQRFVGMHRRFEDRVRERPDAIALVDGREEFTYALVNSLANRVANTLAGLGAGGGMLVGVCLKRSARAVICLMGILKTGAAYVPLDPDYPEERLAFMAADAGISLVVSETASRQAVPAAVDKVVFIDERWPEILRQDDGNPGRETLAADLAYVMYTSGSSGRPKGVAVEHGGVSALIDSYGRVFSKSELDGVGTVTSLNFDISVMDIFATLGLGGTLILVADPMALGGLAGRERIRLLVAAPSTVASLLKMAAIPRSVTTIGLGGDMVRQSLADALYGLGHIQRVYNMYGPTEETVWATYALIPAHAAGVPHIGRPIAKTEVYILDRYLQPVPAGIPGELYLGGPGVARGYLNRPELTAERFVAHPFCEKRDGKARLYRTGDLARFRYDGNIVFLGRIDAQVKIRGFRIEPGEIETVLQQHPEIAEAVVVVREDRHGEKFLQACVVAKTPGQPDEDGLKAYLRERLPTHMVPSVITRIAELPVGPSGKIDHRALPEPQIQPKRPAAEQAPHESGETEALVCRIWQEELGWEGFGLDENFFDIGGHSLMMVAVFSRLKELLSDRLLLTDLYKYPTVRSLAEFVDGRKDWRQSGPAGRPATRRTVAGEGKVAIVGIACRFPGAADKDRFWENIKGGIESISEFSDHELAARGVAAARRNNPNFVRRTGRLDGIDLFDAEFFGIAPREAEAMDPQHRLFLECAWHALEDGGIDPERAEGLIGVYGGCGFNSYLAGHLGNKLGQTEGVDKINLLLGNGGDFLSSRIGYKLNLKGPTVNVQTACSTSMTALHMAVSGLLQGDCDIALAGGVSLGDLQHGYLYREGMILSADGRCRPFDQRADGTVPSQGVGIVVLRRFEEALETGHHIYSTILGTAVNNDGGGKAGFTAPSPAGQAAVIGAAQVRAGIGPETISYVEAHGTGTRVGDPVEVAALAQAFGAGGGAASCALGSVKANIGHPDAAAGIAGIIKTALALQHRILPPQINFAGPNNEITFAGTPFFVNTTLQSWVTGGVPRRAGVSSFGLGGCNGHAVLEEPPEKPDTRSDRAGWQLLPFSAARPDAVAKVAENLVAYLHKHPEANLQAVAYTLQLGRKMFPCREFIVADSVPSAIRQLAGFVTEGVGEPGAPSASSRVSLLTDLGRMWQQGEKIDWLKLHDGRRDLLSLPGYPFRRQRHWIDRRIEVGLLGERSAGEPEAKAAAKESCFANPEADETLSIIAAIWEEYLGLGEFREYTSDDDFFDSGGDSLLAVLMVERLGARFGLALTGDILIGRSTLGQLAEYVRQRLGDRSTQGESPGPNHAVRLKPGSASCPPLFLCHPGAGHLYFYLDLVKHLDIPAAVYGIEAMGLRATEQPLSTIEAIARHHLRQIRVIQGHGPYRLGGSSFGGMVAYEVAQQLLAMDEEVEFLYMVDTPGPGHMVGPVDSDARILASLFADVLNASAQLTERLLTLEGEPEKQIACIVQEAHCLGLDRKIPPHFGRHIVQMVRTHVIAMRNYRPKPYPGFLLFFRPSETTADYSAHAEMAWLPLAAKGANVYTVPGNHITVNMEPNVQNITAHLQRYILDNLGSKSGEEIFPGEKQF